MQVQPETEQLHPGPVHDPWARLTPGTDIQRKHPSTAQRIRSESRLQGDFSRGLEIGGLVFGCYLCAQMVAKTPDELKAAVDSMFRIRAVESPPDPEGLKKVWHRGARHAELVSEIDLAGRVARHEFSLFDDVLIWERGRGFLTGESNVQGSTRGAAKVAFDLTTDPTRLERVTLALEPYQGRDRIIHHLRELVVSLKSGTQPLNDLGQVTGSNPLLSSAVMSQGQPAVKTAKAIPAQVAEAPAVRRSKGLVWVGIGLMVIAVALAVMALK